VGEEDDFVGVRVDAARRFAKDPLFMMAGLMGEFVPMRRLAMEAVNDCVFSFRMGATVGALLYKSGIFGRGGAFTGVVNVLLVVAGVELLNVGIDFLALSISPWFTPKMDSDFNAFVGLTLLVAPNASAVPKLALALLSLVTS